MEAPKLRIDAKHGLDLSGRTIEVIVGAEEPTTFSVHEQLICESSDYFKTAMGERWNGAQTRSVRVEDHDPEMFQIYLNCLYRNPLPVRLDSPGDAGNAEYLKLAKAYVFGDMLMDADFKDVVLDTFIAKSTSEATDGKRWYPVGPVVRYIYENTIPLSRARRLIVDLYTHFGHGGWLSKHAAPEDLPKDFLLDLAISLLDDRELPQGLAKNSCDYHEHEPNDRICYKYRLGALQNT